MAKPKPDPVLDVLERYDIRFDKSRSSKAGGEWMKGVFELIDKKKPENKRLVIVTRRRNGQFSWTGSAPVFAMHKMPVYISAVKSFTCIKIPDFVPKDSVIRVDVALFIDPCPWCEADMAFTEDGSKFPVRCTGCQFECNSNEPELRRTNNVQ